jgi:hypothetical protein
MNAILLLLVMQTNEDKLALLLSAHHELPSRAVFESQVPNVRKALEALALKGDLFRPHRHRALEALAMWPDDDVRRVYRTLLMDPATPELTKHRVLLLVPRVFAGETPRILEPWRTHVNARFRKTAEIALRRSDPKAAR